MTSPEVMQRGRPSGRDAVTRVVEVLARVFPALAVEGIRRCVWKISVSSA